MDIDIHDVYLTHSLTPSTRRAAFSALSLAVAPPTAIADVSLGRLRTIAPGAQLIGTVTDELTHVILETSIGGERRLDELEDDPLPRIC